MPLLQKFQHHRDQARLHQLQANQGNCLERFKQSAGQASRQQAGDSKPKTLVRDARLILTNAVLFDTEALAGASRLCPEAIKDCRGPFANDRLREILGQLDAEKTSDQVLVLKCLAAIANSADSALSVIDLCSLNQSLLGNHEVFAQQETLSCVLDAAQALQYPAWTLAAQAQLSQGYPENAGWLFAQAMARCETSSEQAHALNTLFSTLVECENFLLIAPTVIPFRAAGSAVKEVITANNGLVSNRQRAVLLSYCFEAGQALTPSQWSDVLRLQLTQAPAAISPQLLNHHPIALLVESGSMPVKLLENLAKQVILNAKGLGAHRQQRSDMLCLFIHNLNHCQTPSEQKQYLDAFLNFLAEYNEWDRLCELLKGQGQSTSKNLAKVLIEAGKLDLLNRIFPPKEQSDLYMSLADELNCFQKNQDRAVYFRLLEVCVQANQLNHSKHQAALLEHYCLESKFDKLINTPFDAKQSLAFFRQKGLDSTPLLKHMTERHLTGLAIGSFSQMTLMHRILAEASLKPLRVEQSQTLGECLARLSLAPDGLSAALKTFYANWQPWQPMPLTLISTLKEVAKLSPEQVKPQTLIKTIGNLSLANHFRRNHYTAAVLEAVLVGEHQALISTILAEGEHRSCDVCYSDFSPGQASYRLTKGCQTLQCEDCITNSLQNLNKGNQCQWGCQCTVHSQTAMALNMPPAIVQSIQSSTLASYFAHQSNWQQCEQTTCIGGKPSTEKDCLLCHGLDINKPKNSMVDALKTQKRTVRVLMDHLGQVSGHYNGDGMVRECFCCGAAVSKDRACATVTCVDIRAGGCHQTSDFVGGDRPGEGVGHHHFYHNKEMPAQAYVPAKRNSLLWQLGFYDRNPFVSTAAIPKTHNPKLMARLIASKEQWYLYYAKKIDQLIEKAEQEHLNQSATDAFRPILSNRLCEFDPMLFFGDSLLRQSQQAATIDQSPVFYLPGDPICFKKEDKFWENGVVIDTQGENEVVVKDTNHQCHQLKGGLDAQATCLPVGSMPTFPKQLIEGDRIEVNMPQNGFGLAAGQWTYASYLSQEQGAIKVQLDVDDTPITLKFDDTVAAAGSHPRELQLDHSTAENFEQGIKQLVGLMENG